MAKQFISILAIFYYVGKTLLISQYNLNEDFKETKKIKKQADTFIYKNETKLVWKINWKNKLIYTVLILIWVAKCILRKLGQVTYFLFNNNVTIHLAVKLKLKHTFEWANYLVLSQRYIN